jgi:hypothetical protein
LPDYCVKCDTPAEGYRLKRKLSWHHPAVFLLVLIHLLLYLIVALIVRKKATVFLPICDAHRRRRVRAIAFAWFFCLLSIAVFVGLIVAGDTLSGQENGPAVVGIGCLASLIVFLVSAFSGALIGRVVKVKKIEEKYAWIASVSPAFLARLKDSGKLAAVPEL